MDANRFDDLVKRVATARLTRVGVIRGLAGGAVAALTGMSLTASESEAKKNGKKKRKKKRICLCTGSTVSSCSDQRVKKKKKKKLLKSNPCSYSGKCRGFNPCSPAPTSSGPPPAQPGFPITPDEDDIDIDINIPCLTPGEQGICADGQTCVAIGGLDLTVCLVECATEVDCSADTTCVLGVCLPLDFGGQCDSPDDCATGFCADIDPVTQLGVCDVCDGISVCGTQSDPVCCVADAECINDTCVLQTN